jgi:hypothetical protein
MKLSEDVKAYVDARIKDEKNQVQMYQILIDGYWSGELDMDPTKGEMTLVANPVSRPATPATAHISGAIMLAMAEDAKK